MALLTAFPLPLPMNNGPPLGYGLEEREISLESTTSAFNAGIDQRDTFLGRRCCIICGFSIRGLLEYCHIIKDSDPEIWPKLKFNRWIPPQAKDLPEHEPRNGLLMCKIHHTLFEGYFFFIRFVPDVRKFVFVNYSCTPELQPYHGKAVALDIRDRYVPFPSIFIIHEIRTRGFNPFEQVSPAIPNDLSWQDWILRDGVVDDVSGSFVRDRPQEKGNDNSGGSAQTRLPTTSAGGGSSVGLTLELNSDVIAGILSITRAMSSWKACQMEGTSWTGTAEENIQKYVSFVGVEG